MNKKGQAVVSEYVMIFFVVIAAVVAMTTYVKRGYQARIHDARNFAVDSIMNSGACDANCLAATGAPGNQIPYEYEPYYAQMMVDVGNTSNDSSTATTGNPAIMGAKYGRSTNEATTSITTSDQLPASCSDGSANKPSWCWN